MRELPPGSVLQGTLEEIVKEECTLELSHQVKILIH
jgi:hypothetical protein